MPTAPPTLRPRATRRPDVAYDARRRTVPWRGWYKRARWAEIRAAQLAAEPLCRMCVEAGRVMPATVCDHVEPHRGDPAKFWAGPFQSLCAGCHSAHKQREEHAATRDGPAAHGRL